MTQFSKLGSEVMGRELTPLENLRFEVFAVLILEQRDPVSALAIVLRYGLDGGGGMTFDKIGQELPRVCNGLTTGYSVSGNRARQRVAKGLRVLNWYKQHGHLDEILLTGKPLSVYNMWTGRVAQYSLRAVQDRGKFLQLCVWPGALVAGKVKEFEHVLLKQFGTRVKFEAEIEAIPDVRGGKAVHKTGGRIDAFFYVHSDDIGKFAHARLQAGIRWWEDVVDNEVRIGEGSVYSKEILDKYKKTW